MRPLCCGMRSHPYLSSLLFLSQCRSSFLYLNILPAGCLSSLLYPNFYLDLVGPASIVPWERCIYELANCSDSGRASASMNAVSRGGWWPSAPASTPVPPSPRLLELLGTWEPTIPRGITRHPATPHDVPQPSTHSPVIVITRASTE